MYSPLHQITVLVHGLCLLDRKYASIHANQYIFVKLVGNHFFPSTSAHPIIPCLAEEVWYGTHVLRNYI